MRKREPWIGQAHVVPTGPSILKQNKGAYVHALALATDSEDYGTRVQAELDNLNLMVIELERVATVAEYAAEDRMSDEMWEIAANLSSDEPVQFDTFEAYLRADS